VISPALSVESFSGLTLRSLESKCIDRNLYNVSCNVNRTGNGVATLSMPIQLGAN